MLATLWRVFQRYRVAHEVIMCPGCVLRDAAGGTLGTVTAVLRTSGGYRIEGWAGKAAIDPFDKQSVEWDVPRPPAPPSFRSFIVRQPPSPDTPRLRLAHGGTRTTFSLPPAGRIARVRASAASLAYFAKDITTVLPLALRWLRSGSIPDRQAIARHLGLNRHEGEAPFLRDAGVPAARTKAHKRADAIQIILPVFNGFDVIPETLRRLAAYTDTPWTCHLIDDASTDPRIAPILHTWAEAQGGRVELIQNARNMGFVETVNQAIDRLKDRSAPVVLLNSDAWVADGWASRLVMPLHDDPSIASVTPMSNNAEILSVPAICAAHALQPGDIDALDARAATLSPAAHWPELPTGVGFCMAMSRAWIDRIGAFDPCFSPGYGEEVDWCQRARAAGGRHVAHPGVFVEHHGHESFGQAKRAVQVTRSSQIISTRYPGFDRAVQDFVVDDPLITPRLYLGLDLAARRAPGRLPVYLAHSMGGGAENMLRQAIDRKLRDGIPCIVLRVGGACRWRLELHTEADVPPTAGETDRTQTIIDILGILPKRRLVYSCAVGDTDPVDVPDVLLRLRQPGDHLAVHVHDFFPISPSYTLLNGAGRFLGVPPCDSADAAHQTRRADGRRVTLSDWRRAWGRLIAVADEVRVFSHDSAAHMACAFPDARRKISVRPHATPLAIAHSPKFADPGVVGVLGNIGMAKGAGLLSVLSVPGRVGPALSFVLIGNLDPSFTPGGNLQIHGDYLPGDLGQLMRRYRIGSWFIPSIWPETFSLTTHEVLGTGLPVTSFDLGAQGAAVAAAGGQCLPLSMAYNDVATLGLRLQRHALRHGQADAA